MTAHGDAIATMAHALRMAAAGYWDGEQCDAEATAIVSRLLQLGWRPPRPLPADPRGAPNRDAPIHVRGADACRAAIADARERQAIRRAEVDALRAAYETPATGNPRWTTEPEENA